MSAIGVWRMQGEKRCDEWMNQEVWSTVAVKSNVGFNWNKKL